MVGAKLDMSEFETRLRILKNPRPPLVRAINRSINSGNALVTRAIAGDTGLKLSFVKRYVSVAEASSSRLEASIKVSAARVPLMAFNAKGRRPSRGIPGGVRVKLPGGRESHPQAFITTVRGPLQNGAISGGHLGVFKREGKNRLPIRQLYGPSLWQAFKKHQAAAQARVNDTLVKNVEHEITYALSR